MTRQPAPAAVGEMPPGLLRGGQSAVAGQILFLGYMVDFALSVAVAIAALQAGPPRHARSSGWPAAAVAGYLLLLVLALAAAVITMRTGRRRLALSAEDFRLRSTAVTRRSRRCCTWRCSRERSG